MAHDTGSRFYLAGGKLHIQTPSDLYHREQPLCGIADLSDGPDWEGEIRPDSICEGCAKVYALLAHI